MCLRCDISVKQRYQMFIVPSALLMYRPVMTCNLLKGMFNLILSTVSYFYGLFHSLIWKELKAVCRDKRVNEFLYFQIFTERPANEPPSERLRAETVIDYLHKFPKAVIIYLEYLVFQKKLEVCTFIVNSIEYKDVFISIKILQVKTI